MNDRTEALREQIVAHAVAALPAVERRAPSRRATAVAWCAAMLLISAPLWVARDTERDARFERGLASTTQFLWSNAWKKIGHTG